MTTSQLFQLPFSFPASSLPSSKPSFFSLHFLRFHLHDSTANNSIHLNYPRPRPCCRVRVNFEDTGDLFGDSNGGTSTAVDEDDGEDDVKPTPDDLEYITQIKRVLELLRRNRDMLFGEVKLTIMIEDPREVERRRLLGIDDSDAPTREDLVAALEEVNEGKVPRNRVALKMLAEEMATWPNLEVEPQRKDGRKNSLYAKATDTGIDPKVAAKRLNVDWDSAAEIEEAEVSDDSEVPPAV